MEMSKRICRRKNWKQGNLKHKCAYRKPEEIFLTDSTQLMQPISVLLDKKVSKLKPDGKEEGVV